MTDTVIAATGVRVAERAVLGTSPTRPDAVPKVQGRFAFSSDLWADGMLWGKTLAFAASARPHSAARRQPGVADPRRRGRRHRGGRSGRDVRPDHRRPARVCVATRSCTQVKPVAAVAADHPETARRACEAIVVEYEVLEPLDRPRAGDRRRRRSTPTATCSAINASSTATPPRSGDVVVEGTYDIGMQDQAFLGLESALALPDHDGGGVELFISTQWLHEDRRQIAECLGLPRGKGAPAAVGGVGGAFGAREDVSLQVHVCLLALRTGRPVKMMYGRDESFVGHVHRHPGQIWMRHHARSDGTLVNLECPRVLDGGAYASTSQRGPHQRDHARAGALPVAERDRSTDGRCVRTTLPAARCAASACSKRASRTRVRWTGSPRLSGSIRWRSGCATRSRRAIC